jgi:hypothetical protein
MAGSGAIDRVADRSVDGRWRLVSRTPPTLIVLLLASLAVGMQLGLPPVSVAFPALLLMSAAVPLLTSQTLGPGVRRLCWMVAGGLLGWLGGLYVELGPYGLTVLGSWCASTTQTGGQAVLTKVQMLPLSHLGMLLGGIAGMAAALDWRQFRRSRRCCVLAAVTMPLALVAADLLVFAARDIQAVSVTTLMLASMVTVMLGCGVLVALTDVLVDRSGCRTPAAAGGT